MPSCDYNYVCFTIPRLYLTYPSVPGKSCARTATSFYQDVNYLSSVGEALTSAQGLCNIGEWHSHHRINLPSPSLGDETTVWKHMQSVTGGRFLLFIASITGSNETPEVNIGCFMFSMETKKMTEGLLVSLPGCSPIRGQFSDVSSAPGPEQGVSWSNFVEAVQISGVRVKKARPHVIPQNKTTKYRHEKTLTDKTKLISKGRNVSYGSNNQVGHKKWWNSSSSADEVVKNQPLRDIASPCPEPDKKGGNKSKSILISKGRNTSYGSNSEVGHKKWWNSSSSADEVVKNQPLRDIASPCPEPDKKGGNTSKSIFDCC